MASMEGTRRVMQLPATVRECVALPLRGRVVLARVYRFGVGVATECVCGNAWPPRHPVPQQTLGRMDEALPILAGGTAGDEAFAHGVEGGLVAMTHLEFAQDVAHVRLDCVDADVERV